jgi:hypothetical protein
VGVDGLGRHEKRLREQNYRSGSLNALLGAAISPVGLYNTIVQALSGTLTSFQNINGDPDSAATGFISAAATIAVAAFGKSVGIGAPSRPRSSGGCSLPPATRARCFR